MPESQKSALLEREDVGDVTVVRVKVPMLGNEQTTEALFREVYALIEEAGRPRLLLDLAAVEYLGSMALGKLVMLLRKTREAQGRVALYHATPPVDRLLEVTHLADILPVYADEREALRSFA